MNLPVSERLFRLTIIASILVSHTAVFPLYGKAGQADPTELYRRSLTHFENGEFRAALEGFKELMVVRPANAMGGYFAGRCLVEMNEDLDDAIEWLHRASSRGVPPDVYYYLGKAYHHDYNFNEAIRNYSRFEMQASRQELKETRVKRVIAACRDALEITATYNQYKVMAVTFIDLTDSAEYSQIRMAGGTLHRKPSRYMMPEEDEGLISLMFMPENLRSGDYIYYSGYHRSGRNGAQLFRVRMGTGRSWGDPEEIRSLNTEGDEILPYFDPIGSDLYFASDGGVGIGGFDLYKAHYDDDRDEWTDPINLGFPVNSVMDEYLLLPGTDLGMMMFFSNRQGTDSTVTVYRVHLVEPKKRTDSGDPAMLREIASLGGVAEEVLAEITAISRQRRTGNEADLAGRESETTLPRERPPVTRVEILYPEGETSGDKPLYHELLAEALVHQAASDSLKDLAASARADIRESDDPNDRWVWQKQIMVWEKKARDEEWVADSLFARMDEEQKRSEAGPAVNAPEAIAVDLEGEPGTQPARYPEGEGAGPGTINRFDILGVSPYNENNPIPVDVAIPGGVFYRIQLGAYGRELEPGTFGGISPLTAESLPERGLIKYYAGKFSKYRDVSAALSEVRNSGYEDAFIVAWYNGISISTEKAKQLE